MSDFDFIMSGFKALKMSVKETPTVHNILETLVSFGSLYDDMYRLYMEDTGNVTIAKAVSEMKQFKAKLFQRIKKEIAKQDEPDIAISHEHNTYYITKESVCQVLNVLEEMKNALGL